MGGVSPATVTEEARDVEPCCLGWGKGWHEYDCPDHA